VLASVDLDVFPPLNASLNAFAGVLTVLGFVAIKRDERRVHARFMVAAAAVSAVFLACYLYYHVQEDLVTRFTETGWPRVLYFTILVSHVVLAATVPVLVLRTLYLAAKQRFEAHRRIARWTFPVWVYVSVTGVLVYLMLYQWFPSEG
jgi:putative membrane protein